MTASSSASVNLRECLFSPDPHCHCDLHFTPLSGLLIPLKNVTCFPDCKTVLELVLLKGDRFEEQKCDLSKTFICQQHLQRYTKECKIGQVRKCGICKPVFGKKSSQKSKPHLGNVNREEAYVLFHKYKVPGYYGTVICRKCAADLRGVMESEKIFPAEKLLWLDGFTPQEEFSTDNSEESDSNDSNFSLPLSTQSDDTARKVSEALKDRKRECLSELLHLSECTYKPWVTQSYKSLSRSVKASFLCRTRAILKSVVSVLAPNDADEVIRDLYSEGDSKHNIVLDGNFVKVMKGVAFAYKSADDWATRRAFLSIVAPQISHKLLCSFIPGLTLYRFTSARLHAATMGTGVIIEPKARVVNRFQEAQVEDFINFITSSHISIDLPFGEKVLKLKDGTELFVPNVVRNFVPSRIIQQYYKFCDEMSLNFPPLGISSLLKILDICKASTRRSLAGIDYFHADAGEAFDSLQKMIENMSPKTAEHERLIENLRQGRQYLKLDYLVNISTSSKIADHCSTFSLSDPKEKAFSSQCDHEHNEQCQDCLLLKSTFLEIEQLLKTSIPEKENFNRALSKFQLLKESIDLWKSHQLRTVHQDRCREQIFENLPENMFYIYLDWAMRFLPQKYREAQREWFGKKGISYHISVAVMNNPSKASPASSQNSDSTSSPDKFVYKVFAHAFEQCTQDASFVNSIVRDICERMKAKNPRLQRCAIRSDNAGCYKSAEFILSVPKIFFDTQIQIEKIDFGKAKVARAPLTDMLPSSRRMSASI